MNIEAVQGFQISGYFSRVFERILGSVRALASKVRRPQEEAFQNLSVIYKTFDQTKTAAHSKALAKEIVKVAISESGNSKDDEVVKKTRQLATAVLSNWIRDQARSDLAVDIRTELQEHLNRKQSSQETDENTEPATQMPQEEEQAEAEEADLSISHPAIDQYGWQTHDLEAVYENTEPATQMPQEEEQAGAEEADLSILQPAIDQYGWQIHDLEYEWQTHDLEAEWQTHDLEAEWQTHDLEDVRDIPSKRVIGTTSQFDTLEGLGRSSCAVMSLVALEKMRTGNLEAQEDIDSILVVGSDLYGKIINRIANSLIMRRNNGGESDVVANFCCALGRSVPELDSDQREEIQVQALSEALHGMHLNWEEIKQFLPFVEEHELSKALEHYEVLTEVTDSLGGDQSDKDHYEALVDRLTFGLVEGEPHYGLLTLGSETYMVRAVMDKGEIFIDFVNTHGEAQLEFKAAKRTFTKDEFIKDLEKRHPHVDASEANDYNQIGLVTIIEK